MANFSWAFVHFSHHQLTNGDVRRTTDIKERKRSLKTSLINQGIDSWAQPDPRMQSSRLIGNYIIIFGSLDGFSCILGYWFVCCLLSGHKQAMFEQSSVSYMFSFLNELKMNDGVWFRSVPKVRLIYKMGLMQSTSKSVATSMMKHPHQIELTTSVRIVP